MKIGLPKGLLYYKYYSFIDNFLELLEADVIRSEDTNKNILNLGLKYCVDEACLPIKIFHGHVASIKDKCDLMIIPRIMCGSDNRYICPKFCGLPEMIYNSIPDMPEITYLPLFLNSQSKLFKWVTNIGVYITKDIDKIKKAYFEALNIYANQKKGILDKCFNLNIMLLGHPYNIYDNYINMNIKDKLNRLGVGIVTQEIVEKKYSNKAIDNLYKNPFWTFVKDTYGSSMHLFENKKIDGIIYISSFACGIDSVIIELIKDDIKDFPLLIIKVDEHSGEAGLITRIEAFVDMLERRRNIENNNSPYGKHFHCS